MWCAKNNTHHKPCFFPKPPPLFELSLPKWWGNFTRHTFLVVAGSGLVRTSHAPQIDRDHAVSLRELGHNLVIAPPRLGPTRKQKHRVALAASDIMQAYAVHCCKTAIETRQSLHQSRVRDLVGLSASVVGFRRCLGAECKRGNERRQDGSNRHGDAALRQTPVL